MSAHLSLIAAGVLTVLLIVLLRRKQQVPKGARFPPGPAGNFLVGNLWQLPPFHAWLRFKEWADEYGPLIRISIGRRNHYILSTEKVANDLLRERGTIHSSREQSVSAANLLSGNLRPLFYPYNDRWRKARKLMHNLTMASAATSYQPAQALESTQVIVDLIRSPEEYELHFGRYAAGLIFRLGFGRTIRTGREDVYERIKAVAHEVERVASPGAYLVDSLPWLKYLPPFLAPFKAELATLHDKELTLFRELRESVSREMQEGRAVACWERTSIETQEQTGLTDDESAYVIGTLFEAGSGTTAAAMISFILAIVHHPKWQAKAQAEVDRFVGSSRMPGFDDIPNLPTVRALVKETLRWRPVTAGGVPHMSTKDDIYNGYYLPKGSIIHANQWAIHRDPALYPDPDAFNPGRWLDPGYPTYQEPLTKYPNLQNYSCFGFGRRICPGQNIAERSMYILASRIVWCCQITKAKCADGEITPPLYDYTTGFNVQPRRFPFDLTVRSAEKLKLIEEVWEHEQREDPLKGR